MGYRYMSQNFDSPERNDMESLYLNNQDFNFPAEITPRNQWVGWRYQERDGVRTKVPINARTGKNADATNPATSSSFDQAGYAVKEFDLDGVGFVFSEQDPYSGVDLDNCRNPETGEIEGWAKEFISSLNTYAEVSPSGTGVKLIEARS